MTEPGAPAPRPPPALPPPSVREYRLRVQVVPAWEAELQELSAPTPDAPLRFDTPLELARHLARTDKPRGGLR